ncbi:MAG TPA: c-type cytochrome, partial [Terriglobales bacterium]
MKKHSGGFWASTFAGAICLTAGVLFAQTGSLRLDTGEHIYKTACVACHGPDGKGMPTSISAFEKPDS